jgi:2,3-dihydroxyphenylpropionate 1,2-dioxygenase
MIGLTVCASHAPGMERDRGQREGKAFRLGLLTTRTAITAFDPQLVVLFAADHRRTFAHVTPAFALIQDAELLSHDSRPAERLTIPADLVTALSKELLAHHFDIAHCRGVVLDHGFGQPIHYLLADLASVPLVPIAVNCASPPLPTATRVFSFGQRVGQFLQRRPERILVIGSGGLSHDPPTLVSDRHDLTEDEREEIRVAGLRDASTRIKREWDEAFLDAMKRWDVGALIHMADHATADAGVGANEVRTWIAASASGGGVGLDTLVYEGVPEWITGMAIAISAQTGHSLVPGSE